MGETLRNSQIRSQESLQTILSINTVQRIPPQLLPISITYLRHRMQNSLKRAKKEVLTKKELSSLKTKISTKKDPRGRIFLL